MTRRPAVLVLLALVAILAASCGGGSSDPSNGTRASGSVSRPASTGAGKLIISKPSGFVEYDVKSGDEKPLITAETANTFLLDPAISIDGTQLAYIVQPPPKIEGNRYDAGSDLWVANRDGTDARVVFTHVQPNQLIRFPQWQDDGHVLAIVQEINTADGITSVVYTLERIDVETGERSNVIENVLAYALSPDGQRLTYARLAPQSGETLDAQDLDGSDTQMLVGIDQNLSPFNSPRYSPDGSTVAFASADQSIIRADVEFVSLGIGAGGAPERAADAVLLDGLPEDIWTIDATGGTAVRIADLKEDLPALTWNGDGKHIYVIGAAGLYDVNVETGAVARIGEGSFHGQLSWAPD